MKLFDSHRNLHVPLTPQIFLPAASIRLKCSSARAREVVPQVIRFRFWPNLKYRTAEPSESSSVHVTTSYIEKTKIRQSLNLFCFFTSLQRLLNTWVTSRPVLVRWLRSRKCSDVYTKKTSLSISKPQESTIRHLNI